MTIKEELILNQRDIIENLEQQIRLQVRIIELFEGLYPEDDKLPWEDEVPESKEEIEANKMGHPEDE